MADKTKVADVPFLLNQWDYEKNIDFDIHKMNVGSEKKVEWHCRKCNYKWPGSIVGRYNAKGLCPVCDTGKVIMPGYNDVFTRIPDLMETYDFEKNDGFDIAHQGINSVERIWWKCKNCGREWKAAIVGRKVKNADGKFEATKCPCQKIAEEGVNDIFTLVEGLKDCYDFEKNKGVNVLYLKVSSDIPLHWKCQKCGYEWVSPIPSRINRVDGRYVARGCKECYLNDINRITPIASMPKLLEFWDFEKNTDKDFNLTSAHSNEPAQWKCQKCGYEWEASIKGRTGGSGKCPYCEEHQPVLYPGKNDVLTLCHSASKYFDTSKNEGIDLGQVYVGSTIEIDFKCPVCGREWRAPLNSRIVKQKDGSYRFKVCSCHHSGLRTRTYAEQYPRLISIYDKNNNPKPLDKIQSTEIRDKYHWICDICGEPYYTHFMSVIAAIKNTNTIACPYCSHTLLRNGESFADVHPELIEEYDESNTIDIYQVFPASKKEALWKCLNDPSHKWPATFAARHIGSDRCPICYPTMVRPGVNSLKAIYPDIAEIWSDRNERTADEILYNSSLWVYLNCAECHMEFGTFLKDFTSGKTECPYCAEKRVLPGVNSLADKHPNIAQMWSPGNEKTAFEVWPNNGKWSLWICPECNGEFRAQVNKVVDGSADCPYCADRLLLPGLNSYADKYKEASKRWSSRNDTLPTEHLFIANYPKLFICDECGGEYFARMQDAANGTDECPYCAGKKVLPGFNSFVDKCPLEIVAKWSKNNPTLPSQYVSTSNAYMLFTCDICSGEYRSTIKDVANGIDECPYCADKKVLPGFNSFVDKCPPEIVARWSKNNPTLPSQYVSTSNAYMLFTCDICSGEYRSTIKDVANGIDECPYCADKKVLPGFNSFVDKCPPEIVARWSKNNPTLPSQYVSTSNAYMLFTCDICSGEYRSTIKDVAHGTDECPYCADKKVLPGFNSFVDKCPPEIVARWSENNPTLPSQYVSTSNAYMLFTCDICSGEYRSTIKDVAHGTDECPYCADKKVLPGFNSFQARYPHLIEEWDHVNNYVIADPDAIGDKSITQVWWICTNDHSHHYPMSVKDKLTYQKRNRESCPYCKGRRRKKRHFV